MTGPRRERERDIRGETFLNRSDEGEWVDRVPFYFCPLHRLDFEYFESGGGEGKVKSVGRTLEGSRLGRIEGIRLPMAVVYFYV